MKMQFIFLGARGISKKKKLKHCYFYTLFANDAMQNIDIEPLKLKNFKTFSRKIRNIEIDFEDFRKIHIFKVKK